MNVVPTGVLRLPPPRRPEPELAAGGRVVNSGWMMVRAEREGRKYSVSRFI